MDTNHTFPKDELLRYRQVAQPVHGEEYIIATCTLQNHNGLRYKDYAMAASPSRDGLTAVLLEEDVLRARKTDRDLVWQLVKTEEGFDALYSPAKKKYLSMDAQGARLSKTPERLNLFRNGDTYNITNDNFPGFWHLRCASHDDTATQYVFTSSRNDRGSHLVFLKRVRGLSLQPQGKKLLTAGAVSDIHVDYGIQTRSPYIRKSVFKAAKGFYNKYDLDAMITCGDNISDNASFKVYNRGVLQGTFPREKFLKVQDILHTSLQKSFRNPENAGNIFWLSGNHDCQVGDRQPEGLRFNSNDYSHLLPDTIRNPLYRPAPMDVGVQEELLCYEVRVKGIPFLVLNTPLYAIAPPHPVIPNPHRPSPGHSMEQAEWLEARLKEIEAEMGKNAVIFVQSHYPFHRGCFISNNKNQPSNLDAYVKMDQTMNRYPNLFWFYGHVHGGDDWMTYHRSSECMQTHCSMDLSLNAMGEISSADSPDRGNLRSDVAIGTGFKSIFVGSLAYFEISCFANDGKKFRSGLTELEVPVAQGLAVEVYEDRVVLTMENFGRRKASHLGDSGSYQLKPMVYLLEK